MVISFLSVFFLVFYLAIAVLLVRKYLHTRDVAFIWLAVAVAVWPLIIRLVLEPFEMVFIDRLIQGHTVGFYPFSLVEHGQMSIGSLTLLFNSAEQVCGICLLLIAVLYLSKTNRSIN